MPVLEGCPAREAARGCEPSSAAPRLRGPGTLVVALDHRPSVGINVRNAPCTDIRRTSMSRSIRTRRPFRSASRRPSRPMIEVLEGRVVLTDLSVRRGVASRRVRNQCGALLRPSRRVRNSDRGLRRGHHPKCVRHEFQHVGQRCGPDHRHRRRLQRPEHRGRPRGFRQLYGSGRPSSFKVLNQSGGTTLPGTDPAGAGPTTSNWEMEEALDVEWSHAIAPGANLVLIECDSPSSLNTGVRTAAGLPGVSVVSMSFGTAGQDSGSDSVYTTPAGHEGVTFLAATGDHGSPGNTPPTRPTWSR